MHLRRRSNKPRALDQEEAGGVDPTEFIGAPLRTPRKVSSETSLLSLPEAGVVYAVLLSVLLLISLGAYGAHYRLPSARPVDAPLSSFSEARALASLEKLVSIGVRWSGTNACDVETVEFLLSSLRSISAEHSPSEDPFEVVVHRGSGSFYLYFIDDVLTNSYSNITNVMVRLPANAPPRDGDTSPGALLLNSHFDSGLHSLGASDAGSGVVVLLEVLRNLLASNAPRHHDVILLFNGAEEAILCGAHLFSQHPWAKQVRSVINLEAVGAGGAEVIFQVNSEALSAAYSAVAPYPHGAVLAAEVFQSGIIPSDTDFRMFRDVLGVPGIDMAFYSNGYVYHTMVDDLDAIASGSLQHMGENVLAITQYLLDGDRSNGLLGAIPEPQGAAGGSSFSRPMVFFDFYGLIVCIPHPVMRGINIVVGLGSIAWIWLCSRSREGGARSLVKHIGAVLLCSASSILCAGIASALCVYILNTPLFFYANRWLGVLCFGLPALFGLACSARFLLIRSQASEDALIMYSTHEVSAPATFRGELEQELRVLHVQHYYWLAILSMFVAALGVTTAIDLGSAGIFTIWLIGLVGGHVAAATYEYYRLKTERGPFDDTESESEERGELMSHHQHQHQQQHASTHRHHLRFLPHDVGTLWFRGLLWTKTARVIMAVCVILPMLITLHLWFSVLDLLVPTLGRSGVMVPGNLVMASFVAFALLVIIIPAVPYLLASGNLTWVIRVLAVLSVAALLCTLMVSPFDARHPRRVFIQHVNRFPPHKAFRPHQGPPQFQANIGDHYVVVGVIDSGPDPADDLVPPPSAILMDHRDERLREDLHNLYPFDSHFTPPLKYTGLPPPSADLFSSNEFEHVFVVVDSETYDATSDVRVVHLSIHMVGFEYANVMIDADDGRLMRWSLSPTLPPAPCGHYFARHIAGRHSPAWSISLEMSGHDPMLLSINGANIKVSKALAMFMENMPSHVSPTIAYVENTKWWV